MKTKTVKVGVYRHINYSGDAVGVIGSYGDEYILISDIVEVNFNVIDTSAENDAIKALNIKAAQDRLEVAQKDLDNLL